MPTQYKYISPEQFQWDFYTATNRFPAFVAGVGTGKTMWGLMKADLLSRFYKNNLGLIVRSKFKDLWNSTLKDFSDWTGKHVPQGTKEAKYANGSKILFAHAKELSGLKNVNLGWVYIEQAEEFPTDTQFQMLRHRLRRDIKVDEDYWAKYQKTWKDLDPATKTFLQSLHDEPLNQMMIIANANGHNWVWKAFIKEKWPEYSCVQATSFDNTWLVKNKPKTVEDWRRQEAEAPAKFKQYIMNCHDEVDLDACYYIDILNKMRADDHICHVPYDPSARVYLSFDIGLDCTAIWFLQIIRGRRNLIDYYENTGKFVDHYAKVLDKKGYNYGRVILPHDGKARSKVSGESYAKALRDLGYDVYVNPRIATKDVGINITADVLPSFFIDENKCKDGIEALDHYRREFDEENRVYMEKPLHDWASHPSDSLKEMCQAIKAGKLQSFGAITKNQVLKWTDKWKRTG